jgi:hypothetical protein
LNLLVPGPMILFLKQNNYRKIFKNKKRGRNL